MIDLLAAFPQRRFSLTEIARATEVNRASCLAVLLELEQRGYLCRHAFMKTYWLGPALVAAGQPAMIANPILARARETAERLRKDIDLPMLLSTKIGDEIVCVFSLSDEAGHTAGLRPGERVPLVPPIGMSFIAWAPQAEIDAWIARRARSERVAKRLHGALGLVQERGFHVSLRRPGGENVASILARAASSDRTPDFHREVAAFIETLDVEADQPELANAMRKYEVQLIAAPVIDRETRSIFNLCLGGFREPLAGSEIARIGRHLTTACLEIMAGPTRP